MRIVDSAKRLGVEAARAELINLVNNFYYEKLTALPEILNYMDGLKG